MSDPSGAASEPFVSLDVSSWRAAGVEQLGTKPKQWLRDDRDRLWLWKAATTNLSASGRHAKGDDWAERIVTEIARQLGLPVAMTELAMRAGQPGTVSLSVVDPDSESLVHGNELLAELGVVGIDPHDRAGYTVEAVEQVLSGLDSGLDGVSAFHCFAGYLMLDALAGNTDRHQENWAVIADAGGNRRLAPSFDHASSLGFLLNDPQRVQMLTSRDRNQTPEAWADRARTRFEGHPHPIEVARSADALVQHGIAAQWTARIEPLDLERLVAQVPADRMSSPAREFALRVAEANRRHILSYPPRTMAT